MFQCPSVLHRLCRFICLFLVLCVGTWGGVFAPLSQAHATEKSSLYERLGGYDTISQIIDGFLEKMFADPHVGRYFVGMSTDTREKLRQKNKLLMCKNTGGPCKIVNRDMALAHGGLGITEKDWEVTVTHLTNTLNTLKVGEPEQQELFQLISSLKQYIVERP